MRKRRQTEREKSVVIMIITNSSRTKLMTDEFNKIKGHYACTEKKPNDDQNFFFSCLFCLKLNIKKSNIDKLRSSTIIYSNLSFFFSFITTVVQCKFTFMTSKCVLTHLLSYFFVLISNVFFLCDYSHCVSMSVSVCKMQKSDGACARATA